MKKRNQADIVFFVQIKKTYKNVYRILVNVIETWKQFS